MFDDVFDDELEPNLDMLVEHSWQHFADDLAVRLGDLRHGSFEFIELFRQTSTEPRALIAFTATKSGPIRSTVPNDALPYRDESEWMTLHENLIDLGWRYQTRKCLHTQDFGRRRLHTASKQTIGLLRDTWGVLHPSFLKLRDPISTVTPFSSW